MAERVVDLDEWVVELRQAVLAAGRRAEPVVTGHGSSEEFVLLTPGHAEALAAAGEVLIGLLTAEKGARGRKAVLSRRS